MFRVFAAVGHSHRDITKPPANLLQSFDNKSQPLRAVLGLFLTFQCQQYELRRIQICFKFPFAPSYLANNAPTTPSNSVDYAEKISSRSYRLSARTPLASHSPTAVHGPSNDDP